MFTKCVRVCKRLCNVYACVCRRTRVCVCGSRTFLQMCVFVRVFVCAYFRAPEVWRSLQYTACVHSLPSDTCKSLVLFLLYLFLMIFTNAFRPRRNKFRTDGRSVYTAIAGIDDSDANTRKPWGMFQRKLFQVIQLFSNAIKSQNRAHFCSVVGPFVGEHLLSDGVMVD